ncbi:MAG: DUF1289 domain-containing protein [Gammaproteobacteria bacterium]|nr:DUF1289 domain-containing protein [Gammaproteobacteria bacterium]
MSAETDKPVASPCVRNCCLDDEDICLGCFRHIEEITGWSAMDDAQRQACLARCASRRAQRESLGRWPFASP